MALTVAAHTGKISGMGIWLYKPIYESGPYMYLVAGAVMLIASLYFNYQYWPVSVVAGLAILIFGLLNLKRRLDFRNDGRKSSSRDR